MATKTLQAIDTKEFEAAHGEMDSLMREMDSRFIQRNQEILILFVAIIARKNVFFGGPPGVAKTALTSAFGKALGMDFFTYLIRKDTTQEELFGPYDLPLLKKGQYKRILTNRLGQCQVALLDEIWKGSSGANNSILTAINEKQYDNGTCGRIDIPLQMVMACSNELPQSDDLHALWDRFLFRRWVTPLQDRADRLRLMAMKRKGETIEVHNTLSPAGLECLRNAAENVDYSPIEELLCDVLEELGRQHAIEVSDRSLVNIIDALCAYAVVQGRMVCEPTDLLLLADIIVADPEVDHPKVLNCVAKLVSPDLEAAMKLHDAAVEIYANGIEVLDPRTGDMIRRNVEQASAIGDSGALGAINSELKKIVKELQKLGQSGQVEGLSDKIAAMQLKVARIAREALGI